MRRFLISFMLFGVSAFAQDATEINVQAAQQANDAAIQASQQASTSVTQAAQQAGMDSGGCQAAAPKISLKAGSYSGDQTVLVTDRSRHAAIYYTLGGWTPTDRSTRYDGPIAISSTSHLQAFAMVPGCSRSPVSEARYVLPGGSSVTPVVAKADGIVRKGTAVTLRFVSDLSSRTAVVGEPIRLALVSDVEARSQVIRDPSAYGTAVVTEVKHSGICGEPGSITFSLQSLRVGGSIIPLSGSETEEGKWNIGRRGLIFIPVVGTVQQIARRGTPAEILSDTSVVATVASDTLLR